MEQNNKKVRTKISVADYLMNVRKQNGKGKEEEKEDEEEEKEKLFSLRATTFFRITLPSSLTSYI